MDFVYGLNVYTSIYAIMKGNRSQKVKTGAWRWCKTTDKNVTVKIY